MTSNCTGTEAACTAGGVTDGLCVTGVCAPCNTGVDNANCTAAYGGAGATAYVCDTAGECVAGNCNTDADCTGTTAGEICGLTTANACGKCTTDVQCQNDPTYGAATICDTTSGACVSSTCTNAAKTCANAADICCDVGGAADCAAADTCACIPGAPTGGGTSCCQNSDCPSSAPVCGGGGTANVCGKCTADSQCPAGDVCILAPAGAGNLGTCEAKAAGLCAAPIPGNNGGAPGACTPNPSDMCCNPASGLEICIPESTVAGADPCCPGTAGNTYCAMKLAAGATCDPNALVCTACAAVAAVGGVTTYVVDPAMGSDTTGTGSAESTADQPEEGCALKTITRALQIIGTPVAPTVIEVVGGATGVGAGETFPLVIPAHVTVTTKAGGGTVTVTVPGAKTGFTLEGNTSIIEANAAANSALVITTGTTAATQGTNGVVYAAPGNTGAGANPNLTNVTISGFVDSGIDVTSGVVSIGQGVVSTGNAHGLFVEGGEAEITVPANDTATTFNKNSAHGILVNNSGFIDLVGSVTTADTGVGTIETNENGAAGVWIQQGAGGVTVPPTNVITGLVSFGNTAGNGMRIVSGSQVTVRNSAFLFNAGNGIVVSSAAAAAPQTTAGIDLGDTTTNGGNTFQTADAASANKAAGLCLDVANGQAPLDAVGNIFQGGVNCANAAATLLLNKNNCGNVKGACASGFCDLGLLNPGSQIILSNNTFNVAKCSQ